ncbi:glycosyltransferase family 4 protein [Roseobacter sp. EG26]|uniref:glycosyltransferase family 4 protein n=1 Tax=Roseobacter sp. EG26 TaxID=3412477 RepID=UPI003CE59E2C
MTQDPSPFRLAYLTGVYPLASHTFIQREIAALRALGSEIAITSIRKPDAIELIGPEEEAARDETFYVLAAAKNPLHLLGAHAALFLHAPGRWLKTLRLALRTNRPGAKGMIWQLFYFLEAGVLARYLQQNRISHLHNHFADSSATVSMLASGLADIPYSFTLHGPTELFAPESWHMREKVARAALVVCISHFARSQVMLFSDPGDWHKLRIVHCGVTPARYADSAAPASSGMRLLFVGRLDPVKGLRVLFEAFEAARATQPDITLTVIGDGQDREWVEANAGRIGGIDVLGYKSQSEVAEALGQADVLVLPSFAEGVPVALMEAMVSRRPVIATRVGGVAELVEDGISGRMVAPGNAAALAEVMIDLAADPGARQQMGEAGRAKVCAEFDIDQEAIWLKALFEGTAGDSLRPVPEQAKD